MKRIKVMIGKRRMMVLLTLTVLVLAAAALVASSASFTASSANPGNVFTAGSLYIGNFRADGTTDNTGQVVASLSVSGMKPGDSTSGTEVIKNTGSLPGTFTLSGVMDTSAPTYLAAFANYLTLTVTEDGATLVNAQPLSSALSGSNHARYGGRGPRQRVRRQRDPHVCLHRQVPERRCWRRERLHGQVGHHQPHLERGPVTARSM